MCHLRVEREHLLDQALPGIAERSLAILEVVADLDADAGDLLQEEQDFHALSAEPGAFRHQNDVNLPGRCAGSVQERREARPPALVEFPARLRVAVDVRFRRAVASLLLKRYATAESHFPHTRGQRSAALHPAA